MKLRIHDDSVRLRVTVSETRRLADGLAVTSRTRFPGGTVLRCNLEPADVPRPDVRLEATTLRVRVPRDEVLRWARQPELVSLHASVASGEAALDLLVEKDFACLAPRAGDDATDLFVNPAATAPTA
jgi:hypothetical protein